MKERLAVASGTKEQIQYKQSKKIRFIKESTSTVHKCVLIFTFLNIIQYSVSSDKRNVLEEMAKHLLEPANKGQRPS